MQMPGLIISWKTALRQWVLHKKIASCLGTSSFLARSSSNFYKPFPLREQKDQWHRHIPFKGADSVRKSRERTYYKKKQTTTTTNGGTWIQMTKSLGDYHTGQSSLISSHLIYHLTARVVGHHRWFRNQFPPFLSVLHGTLELCELQACPFNDVVFPPLPQSALFSSCLLYTSPSPRD